MVYYDNINPAEFINRPNRFIANIKINGKIQKCHVKNTGRCKELLVPGAKIFVQRKNNSNRKTNYDLISVYKGTRLINVDSQVPNKVFYNWILRTNFFGDVKLIKPEAIYKNSRFDYYIETECKKIWLEVKGVTLEKNGVALFPDAPTERGVKHVNDLITSLSDGYEAWIVFVIQMKDILYFTPNNATQEAFGYALKQAKKSGVKIIALDCNVTQNSIEAADFVKIVI